MIASDPELKEYVNQPDFMQMIANIQKNPQIMQAYMNDPRLMKVITKVLQMQINKQSGGAAEPQAASDPMDTTPTPAKEQGNAAYKAKKFDEAIAHYNKAVELDPTDMTFLTNRAAANMEAKRFEECIKDCEEAIQVGRSNHASFELIAKAYARIGSAHKKLGNLEKAIEALQT